MKEKKIIKGKARPDSNITWQLLGVILLAVAGKSAFVLLGMPSMWIWRDEAFYFMTAYDIFHFGSAGTPHPNFLFYPPLTSIVIAPIHFIEIPDGLGYRISLIILNVIQAIGAIAGYLIAREIFGVRSRLLLFLLLIGPPAYMGFCLRSETLFIALYLWLLYFFVRQIKTGKPRHALMAGLLIGLMVLTRKNGIGLFASVLVSLAIEISAANEKKLKNIFGIHILTIAAALAVAIAWKLVMTRYFQTSYGYHGILDYLEKGLLPALSDVENFWSLTSKFLANLSYVVLSTYGACAAFVLMFCTSRRTRRTCLEEEWRVAWRLVLYVLTFLFFSAFTAAVHMFMNSARPDHRYLLYGRYMDYFSAPLMVLSIGILARGFQEKLSKRRLFLLATLVLCAIAVAIIPGDFFEKIQGRPAANNMGIGWLLALNSGSHLKIIMIAVFTSGTLVFLLTASRANRSGRNLRHLGFLILIILALYNLVWAGSLSSGRSRALQASLGAYSSFADEHPKIFEKGMFVDEASLAKAGNRRRDRLSAYKVVADHVDKVIVGTSPEDQLGKLPVMTRNTYHGFEILFENKTLSNRIYGEKLPDE